MKKTVVIFVLLLLIAIGAYVTYEYVKRDPPNWLIGLVTKNEPPPPLPAGESAPLTAPEGFAVTIFSRNVPGARDMTLDPKGVMLVSLMKEGKIVALPDVNADGVADEVKTVLEGLSRPHGILVLCSDSGNPSVGQDVCTLYVAEPTSVKAYRYDADTFTAQFVKTVATLPNGDGHFTRSLLPHPDGTRLLISVGSSCNVCEEQDARRAAVLALDLRTNEVSTFATGLRNTVFMTVDPVRGDIWGTDNGRDLIGDDIPPDEVNIIREGGAYGWPICYGANVHDTDFDSRQYFVDPCRTNVPAHINLQAHSAALGLAFVPEEGWPEDMWHDLLIAYHGSWNRSVPTGYKVVRVTLDNARQPIGEPADFLTGFLAPGADDTDAIGRPVDILIQPGGVLYVSDDRAGAIYRVTWEGE